MINARWYEPVDPIFQPRVVQIGNTALDRIVEPLQTQIGFGGVLVQFRDMLAPPHLTQCTSPVSNVGPPTTCG